MDWAGFSVSGCYSWGHIVCIRWGKSTYRSKPDPERGVGNRSFLLGCHCYLLKTLKPGLLRTRSAIAAIAENCWAFVVQLRWWLKMLIIWSIITMQRYASMVYAVVCLTVYDMPLLYPHTHNHFTTQVSRDQKCKTRKVNQSWFTGARDSEWHWHQLGHMQICTLTQTHNYASIPLLSFFTGQCPFCHPTNTIKALKTVLCQNM